MSNSDFPRMRYSDVTEFVVLDQSAGAFPNLAGGGLADAVTAETTVGCQTASTNIQGCKQLDIFVDATNVPAASKLYLKIRFSGKQSPDPTVPTDWGFVQIDDIATTTGLSAVKEYVIEADLVTVNGVANVAPRRYCFRIEQISGRFASAIIWADTAGVQGTVYFQRQGGSM